MFSRLLPLILVGASVVFAAPVGPSLSTSEPTNFIVMPTSTPTSQPLTSTIDASLEARQWELTPSAPAWTEPAWTQPAWSDPAIAPVPTAPVWTPSISYSYTEASIPTPTPTYSFNKTHQPDPKDTRVNIIIAAAAFCGMFVLALMIYLISMIRRYFHRRALPGPSQTEPEVEMNAALQDNSQAPALDTSLRTAAVRNVESNYNTNSTPLQGQDIVDAPRFADPLYGSSTSPRYPSPVYQNNIPPQHAHYPVGETEPNRT